MDTFVLILALGLIAILAIVILVYRNARKEVKKIEHESEEPKTHTFQAGHNHVSRQVSFVADVQHHQGAKRKVMIEAAPMPDMSTAVPSPEKGIDQVLALVMNPVVRLADTKEEMWKFEPPLQVKVTYTEADVNATTPDEQGKPKLSLVLVYQEDAAWKWERLKTHVEPDASKKQGTLSAKIHTLRPKDPLVIGRP